MFLIKVFLNKRTPFDKLIGSMKPMPTEPPTDSCMLVFDENAPNVQNTVKRSIRKSQSLYMYLLILNKYILCKVG